jgi:hypothetical protein
MHSFPIVKFDLNFIENIFFASLYLQEMLNSVISLQIMIFASCNIDTP